MQSIVSQYLRNLGLAHLRDEMTHPNLAYQISYNAEALQAGGYAAGATEFRIDGREHARLAAPLSLATIGTNGRDTETGELHFLAADIDGTNHAAGHANLEEWIAKLKRVPELQIHRSRSGNGYHLFVFPARKIVTACNQEITGYGEALKLWLAEAINDEGFPAIVDCTGLMYYASPNPGPNGYELIKPAECLFTDTLEPAYDPGAPDIDVQSLKELEPPHQVVVDWLKAKALKDFIQVKPTIFRGHTTDFAAAHKALNLKGNFETVASGQGDTKWNCYAVAIPGGAFILGQWGSSLEASWQVSERGGRYTFLNMAPPLADYIAERGLIQNPRNGSTCLTRKQAAELCQLHGKALPESGAEYFTASEEGGHLVIAFDVKPSERVPEPWTRQSPRKAALNIPLNSAKPNPANRVRVAYAPDGVGFRQFRRVHNHWQETNYQDAFTRLRMMGLNPVEIDRVLTTDQPLRIVNAPFEGEFPSKFDWNRGAIQLAFPVSKTPGDFKHWQKILEHCGQGFNEAVVNDDWCAEFGIHNGADYLKMWSARVLRFPKARLPALGFFSEPQNCGKSTFPVSLGKLMTRGGYSNALAPLLSEFNYSLLGCILWDFDDADLAQRHGELYSKLQNIITNDTLSVVGKGKDETVVDNCLHITHSANLPEKFAIQAGDTRWSLAEVSPLEEEIPADTLMRALVKEAPYYLETLFTLPMPPEPAGRLFLPTLDTPIKHRLMVSRSERGLTDDQTKWLKRLRELAGNGELKELTPFDRLQELIGMAVDVQAFKGAWSRYAVTLEADGYKVTHRKNARGRTPAAWSVTK